MLSHILMFKYQLYHDFTTTYLLLFTTYLLLFIFTTYLLLFMRGRAIQLSGSSHLMLKSLFNLSTIIRERFKTCQFWEFII